MNKPCEYCGFNMILTEKEIEVLKSCIFMALREGLYDFRNMRIKGELTDASEKDIEAILEKFGMSRTEVENFIKNSM